MGAEFLTPGTAIIRFSVDLIGYKDSDNIEREGAVRSGVMTRVASHHHRMATAFLHISGWWKRWWFTIPASALALAKDELQRRLLPFVRYIDRGPLIETPGSSVRKLRASPWERALAGLPSVPLLDEADPGVWFDGFMAEPYVVICEDCTRVLWDESIRAIILPNSGTLNTLHDEITKIWPSVCVASSDERLRPFLGRPAVMNKLPQRIADASHARLEQALFLLESEREIAIEQWRTRALETLARGESIKPLVVAAGLKQNTIAARLGVKASTVSRIADGTLRAQRENLVDVCCGLLKANKSSI
jgi:hypothetical protein